MVWVILFASITSYGETDCAFRKYKQLTGGLIVETRQWQKGEESLENYIKEKNEGTDMLRCEGMGWIPFTFIYYIQADHHSSKGDNDGNHVCVYKMCAAVALDGVFFKTK